MNESEWDAKLRSRCILIVEDIEISRKMLRHSLNGHGYHNIITANDGREGLELTEKHKPDLVILDLMMPHMDGFEYCSLIRNNPSFDNTPIIVQTALSDMDRKLSAFKLGANDYICKPLDPEELLARVRVHLSQKILMEELKNYKERTSAELEAARTMQDRLLPTDHQRNMCERVFDIRIASHYETSSTLGGDCWGIWPLSDRRLALYMFDFSGRGIPATLNVFRMHTYIQEYIPAGSEPGYFLSSLNRHLYPLLGRDELATMFYGIIDTEANCLLYASAAAPPAHIHNPIAGSTMLNGTGLPLCVAPGTLYETKYAPFSAGSLLTVYSDCINETRNEHGEFLSDDSLHQLITEQFTRTGGNPAADTISALNKRLREHNPAPVFDDNTMMAFYRNP